MGVADRLGALSATPVLELGLVDPDTHVDMGHRAMLDLANATFPKRTELPDYREGSGGGFEFHNSFTGVNRDYWRELATYLRKAWGLGSLTLAVRNAGSVAAQDVRLAMVLKDADRRYRFLAGCDFPNRPLTRPSLYPTPTVARRRERPAVSVDRRGDAWHVECSFGKIQPHELKVLGDSLWIGSGQSGAVSLEGRLFADNLGEPAPTTVSVTFEVTDKNFSLEDLRQMHQNILASAYRGVMSDK